MAVTENKVLSVTFILANADTQTITFPDFDPDKTDAEFDTGVDAMIASGAMAYNGQAITGVKSIKKTVSTTTDVPVIA